MKTRIGAALRTQNATLAAVIIVGVILLAIKSGGGFLTANSINTFFEYLAIPIVIGLAQMATLAVGQMNLAVGSIGGFAACLAGVSIVQWHVPVWAAAVLAVLVGFVVGLLNGLIVVLTQINGFIVTLATMTILLGGQYALVNSQTVKSSNWQGLQDTIGGDLLGIPVIFIIAIVIAIVLSFAYRNMLVARKMLASGGNPLATTLAGISNNRSLVAAHALSGLLCGVAALLVMASLPGVNTSVGGDWLLQSFAAPIIGGVSLSGGAVAVLGTVLAAGVIRLVDSARAAFLLDPSWLNFVIGAVVLGTVALDKIRTGRRSSKRRATPPTDAPPTAAVRAIDGGS